MPLQGIDDANIYFVYMKHLSCGEGFVYNAGESPVEGFTSILWTLIGGGLYWLSNGKIEFALFTLSLFCLVFALTRFTSFVQSFFGEDANLGLSTYAILALLSLSPGYFEWSVLALMDSALWNSIILFVFVEVASDNGEQIAKKQIRCQVLLVLMVFTRPESLLWCFAVIGLIFAKQRLGNEKNTLNVLQLAGITGGSIVLLTLWRIIYFGYPLPNTYYAKVSDDRWQNLIDGWRYLNVFVAENSPLFPWIILFGSIVCLSTLRARRKHCVAPIVSVAFLLIATSVPLATGGDHFNLGRFMQPVTPIAWFLFLIILESIGGAALGLTASPRQAEFLNRLKTRKRTFYALGVLFCLLVTFNFFLIRRTASVRVVADTKGIRHEFLIAQSNRIDTERLNHFFEGVDTDLLPSIGVLTAGGTAYAYNGSTVDLLGLNNEKMAHATATKNPNVLKNHASFNVEVFFELRPDFLWLQYEWLDDPRDLKSSALLPSPEKHSFNYFCIKDLWNSRDLFELYRPAVLQNKENKFLAVIASVDYLENAKSTLDTKVEVVPW